MKFYSNNFEKHLIPQIQSRINDVLLKGDFILGDSVLRSEEEIAKFLGVKYAIAVASGTDALYIALKYFNFPKGSEIITTPFTFFSTSETIISAGYTPVFCDIDETQNIDVSKIESLITSKTKAILPVHIFGKPCNMKELLNIANKYNLKVIEDCAQAMGAKINNNMVGSLGDAGCLSFYPTKNLGAYGDGGMIITNNKSIYQFALIFRNQGSKVPYNHTILGKNSRFDTIQSEILRVKLPYLKDWNEKRRKNATLYNSYLKDIEDISLPIDCEGHVYHQYTIKVNNREELINFLKENGVPTMIYYPIPLHKQPILKNKYLNLTLEVAEETCKKVVSLPIYPGITEKEITYICMKIFEFYKTK